MIFRIETSLCREFSIATFDTRGKSKQTPNIFLHVRSICQAGFWQLEIHDDLVMIWYEFRTEQLEEN